MRRMSSLAYPRALSHFLLFVLAVVFLCGTSCAPKEERDIKRAIGKHSASALQGYVAKWPHGVHIAQATEILHTLEEVDLRSSQRTGTLESMIEYFDKWPNGQLHEEALALFDGPLFREANARQDIGALRRYITLFGDGVHRSEAKGMLDRLLWGVCSKDFTLASFRDYMTTCPEGDHLVEAGFAWAIRSKDLVAS